MEFIIEPYVKVGKIRLGMSVDEVKNIMESEPEKFLKFDDDEHYTDSFECCHVFYNGNGICEAVELFAPAKVVFNSQNLLGVSYSIVKDYISQFDEELEFDETGFTSLKLGFGVYAPFADSEPHEPVEGVIVFDEEYYI